MKHSEYKTIEDHIKILLTKGSLGTISLLQKVEKSISCTKQGFYKALRKLKKDEVIVIHNKKVSLSYLWIKKQAEFYSTVLHTYTGTSTPSENFLFLADTDAITYQFKNADTTDAFWIHALSILNQKVSGDQPLCIYNPHEWFLLVRNESEKALFANVEQMNRKLVVLADNKNPFDTFIKKDFNFKTNNYYIAPKKVFNKNNYYVNIIGDYTIEVWIDKKTSNLIDQFYTETSVFNDEAKLKLTAIIQARGKNKLVISRDKEKSEKLRKIFKKFFVI